ncbi:MAG: acyl-CoA thioester hydrolase/BAAT C-terminal domain-containing protein [Gemmatimonadaceae bacterium]
MAIGSTHCRSAPVASSTPGSQSASAINAEIMTQTAPGYIAHVHRPVDLRKGQRAPAILLIGGSGGGIGWQDYMGDLLAQHGFVVMSLAFFAMDSLPKELDRIPLEVFDSALNWLSRYPSVDRTRIGIGAVSKGAEAALLVASNRADVAAVGVFSPSGYVFQSVTRDFRSTSSWTRNGVDVPFIPYGSAPTGSPTVEFYRAGRKEANAATLELATIPVERINGDVLLLSGDNDTLWGSGELSELIVSRLREKNFSHAVNHTNYPNAGHLISSIRTDDVTYRGGTKQGNDFAQTDGQRRFIEFFVRTLRGK